MFLYNNFYYTADQIVGHNRELRKWGIPAAYYDFITSGDNLEMQGAMAGRLKELGVPAALGLASSFWATCCSKGNSAVYREMGGYGWMLEFFRTLREDAPFSGFQHTWITIWSDYGEDNFFVPMEKPFPFGRNRAIPVWTHRGFYQAARHLGRAWRFGEEAPAKTEGVYWCYRQHPKGLPTQAGDECQPGLYNTNQERLDTWAAAVDAVFVLTRLREPAVLQVTLGGRTSRFDCPAGWRQHQMEWGADRGRPEFALIRDGRKVLAARGGLEITDHPLDLKGEFTRNMHQYADYAETPAGKN